MSEIITLRRYHISGKIKLGKIITNPGGATGIEENRIICIDSYLTVTVRNLPEAASKSLTKTFSR
jgi:hypothetical protein